MTKKKAAFGNNFTPEQRAARAEARRRAARRARRVPWPRQAGRGGHRGPPWPRARKTPSSGRIKAKRLLMALPGVGAAKAQSAMTAIGIAESRRVAGIGQRQAEKLVELFG